MKCPSVIVLATIVLFTLQCSEARFLNLGILEGIGNRLEDLKDKIKEQIEHQWRPETVTQSTVVPEEHQVTSTTAADLPDIHFPDEGGNEIVEMTTMEPEVTTESRRLIEVPLINGGCPSGYRRVGDRCREVFAGRRRRRR